MVCPARKGKTMKAKAKAKVSMSERAAKAVQGALITSKAYETSIGMLYHTRMFLMWLLGYATESELRKATVRTETGLAIKPSKASILPASYLVACAKNTTGRAETVRIFDAVGEFTGCRFCFASPKFKYQGWNVGEKLAKEMASTLGIPEASLMQIRQGNKKYFWNDDFSILQAYCLARFGKESKVE